MQKLQKSYIRNIIFGLEDSLVSSVGVLFGMAAAGISKENIITTGLVVVFVEALSMGAGAYLSESTLEDKQDNVVLDGVLMFFSYLFAGFYILIPYVLLEIETAKYLSIVFSFVGLYLIGFLPRRNPKSGLKMLVIAGMAIIIGYIIGHVSTYI